jgi:hypothetical protein
MRPHIPMTTNCADSSFHLLQVEQLPSAWAGVECIVAIIPTVRTASDRIRARRPFIGRSLGRSCRSIRQHGAGVVITIRAPELRINRNWPFRAGGAVFICQYHQTEATRDGPLTERPEDWDSFKLSPPDAKRADDPQYWRDRANEVRIVASRMKDDRAIDDMLRPARNCDVLADLAESSLRAAKPSV